MGLFGDPKVAMCRECNIPLINTFAFSKAEFYCINCGRRYGWLDPKPADETPELMEQYNKIKAEWDEMTDRGEALIKGGVMLKSCFTCKDKYEPHWQHATEEEKERHEAAMKRIEERVNVAA